MIDARPTTRPYAPSDRVTFCPGPGAVLDEWHSAQTAMFGRNDPHFHDILRRCKDWIRGFVGRDKEVVPLAGSGTTAACIALRAFCVGRVAVVDTGFYADRWLTELQTFHAQPVDLVPWSELARLADYDTVVFVYVETARVLRFDIETIRSSCGGHSRLIVDATASIGLESHHHLADVLFFSSCKGLLGPTGAGFICYSDGIVPATHREYVYELRHHAEIKYTIPFNVINALEQLSKAHARYVERIRQAGEILCERFGDQIVNQNSRPQIGVGVRGFEMPTESAVAPTSIFYIPRRDPGYAPIFLLGIVGYASADLERCLIERLGLA